MDTSYFIVTIGFGPNQERQTVKARWYSLGEDGMVRFSNGATEVLAVPATNVVGIETRTLPR